MIANLSFTDSPRIATSSRCGPSQRAFTLVELLVVIGIIALLISILLPSLNKAKESANGVKCLSNLRQIVMAAHLYANDHKGHLTPTRMNDAGNPWSGNGGYPWPYYLTPYLDSTQTMFDIPWLTIATFDPMTSYNAVWRKLACPSADVTAFAGAINELGVPLTYSINFEPHSGGDNDERGYAGYSYANGYGIVPRHGSARVRKLSTTLPDAMLYMDGFLHYTYPQMNTLGVGTYVALPPHSRKYWAVGSVGGHALLMDATLFSFYSPIWKATKDAGPLDGGLP